MKIATSDLPQSLESNDKLSKLRSVVKVYNVLYIIGALIIADMFLTV